MATQLTGKIVISGKITVVTGLRIGAGNNDFELGSPQLSIVRSRGVPFIPGSSLKGKLRSLLAKYVGSPDIQDDSDEIKEVFGAVVGKDSNSRPTKAFRTRLLVRDCILVKGFDNTKEVTGNIKEHTNRTFTESKWENIIKRVSGGADKPREVERVPEGSEFAFELVYDTYNDSKEGNHLKLLKLAMQLLEDDYLGGYGSRGYGKVKFDRVEVKVFEIKSDEYKLKEQIDNQLFTWEA